MKLLSKLMAIVLLLCFIASALPARAAENVQKIVLTEGAATLNGQAVTEYDYTWHADPSQAHEDVKNSPAEYYTGTKPSGEEAVYIAHDIIYYPELEQSKFQQVNYDGESEWVYMYEAEGYEQYIFSTLPVQRNGFPSQMMHTAQEAYENPVLHITQPGTYELTGTWKGQIWVDLGDEDDVYADPTQKVTLILSGVDITCTVAPGVVFYSVYECDNAWEDAESYSQNVDTSDAGANVVLADGTVNNVTGTNVFRILKTKYKDENASDAYPAQKKSWKIDGAFYSYQSMNISGGGTLNITAGFEGLDTEHHLTLNGGNINIYSQDDGINVNEDGVSVITVNGGNLHICAGLGAEGDGIDSNGYLVVNGGTVITMANPGADSGLDSDFGSFVNGGTVVALGATMDWAESDSTSNTTQPVLNLRFGASQSADEAIVVTDTDGKVVFAYDPDKDEVTKDNQRTYSGAIVSAPGLSIGGSYHIYIGGDVEGAEVSGVYDASTVTGFTGATQQGYSGNTVGGMGGMGGMGRPGGELPEGMTLPDGMNLPEGMTPPDGMALPDGMNLPEDMTPPDDNQRPGKPGDMGSELPEGGFDQSQQPGGGEWNMNMGANCSAESVFTLSQQVNAFSGVADLTHSLIKVEAKEPQDGISGNIEHYACSVCGKLFADEAAARELTVDEVSIPVNRYGALIIALYILAAAVLVVGTLGIVYFIKRKKHTAS